MKIAVCAKQIPDPANPIEYSNGNVIRPEEQVLDDTDRYGIEVALQLKEKYDAEVTVISMTKVGTEKGIQQALQMGPDNALVLEDESLVGSNSLMTANVLSELAKRINADIVIFGTESTDGYAGVVPQQVSRILNIPCISYVKNIEIDESVTLTRQTIEGESKIDTLAVACIDAVSDTAIFPCGLSRQRMSEFNTENVIVVDNNGYKKYKFSEILPFDFKF